MPCDAVVVRARVFLGEELGLLAVDAASSRYSQAIRINLFPINVLSSLLHIVLFFLNLQ
jgi:hypothetical protein